MATYRFEYTASRGLKAGVTVGDVIAFDTYLVSVTPTNSKSTTVTPSLSGRRRTRVLNRTETLAIESPVATTTAALADWHQLLESIDDGQTFTLDGVAYQLDDTWQQTLVSKAHLTWRFTFTLYRVRS